MAVKQGLALASIGLMLVGCVNTRSNFMEMTGAKAGELPVLARPDYQLAQNNFRTKLAQFRSTGVMPADVASYIDCNLSEAQVQAISGYTELLAAQEGDDKKGSMAAEIAQDADSAGSAVNVSQQYQWQGGAVLSEPGMCSQLRSDPTLTGLKYLVNSQYVLIIRVNSPSASVSDAKHSTRSQVHIANVSDDEQIGMTISSIGVDGGMFDTTLARAAVSMNNIEDPNFSYRYRKGSESITMTETASAQGIYQTFLSVELGDGKVRNRGYAGAELTMITRSRNGKPHGLQEFIKLGLPASCYDNGEEIQSSNCERF